MQSSVSIRTVNLALLVLIFNQIIMFNLNHILITLQFVRTIMNEILIVNL